jgi:hypothetical protein
MKFVEPSIFACIDSALGRDADCIDLRIFLGDFGLSSL